MNKSESKYFNTAIKMDKALIKLLNKKDFDFITVKEICKEAGVNRSTYYLHYENTVDLLEEAIVYTNNEFLSYFKNADESFISNMKSKSNDELMLINTSGIAIRINVSDISVTSRSAMGVRLMRTSEEEKVVAIAKIAKTGDEEKDEQLSLEACADNEVVEANKDTSLDRLVEESQKEETEE